MGPASARSFSSGVGTGALGSFFAGALLVAGLAGPYTHTRISNCRMNQISWRTGILTVPGLNRPKNEVIVEAYGGGTEMPLVAHAVGGPPEDNALQELQRDRAELDYRNCYVMQ